MKILTLSIAVCGLASISQAATIQFNLIGVAGAGLLPGNEPGVISGGTGGEFSTGITFDDVSKVLTINVAWGSANGFTNLTGIATNAHLHGPTANNNGNGFTETAGPLFGLTGAPFTFNDSASAGSITGNSVAFNATNEAALMAGKFYINIHTGANVNGENRGFLVAVPEPGSLLLGMAALGGLSLRRRRA